MGRRRQGGRVPPLSLGRVIVSAWFRRLGPAWASPGPISMPHDRKPRLLVFVIAYYAEETLTSVLERIPRSIFSDHDCEVLVGRRRPLAIARTRWGGRTEERTPEIAMTVLRNEHNQGYGGNQKVGYAFAIREGFDFVAMIHGDGQYAPEELPSLVAPLREGPR